LFAGKEADMASAAAPFGLGLDATECRPMPSNLPSAGLPAVNALELCPIERVAGRKP
jgi:hypothetical protein